MKVLWWQLISPIQIPLPDRRVVASISLLAGSVLSAEMGQAHRSVNNNLNLTFVPESWRTTGVRKEGYGDGFTGPP